jgi:hypothetical protein
MRSGARAARGPCPNSLPDPANRADIMAFPRQRPGDHRPRRRQSPPGPATVSRRHPLAAKADQSFAIFCESGYHRAFEFE